MSFIRETTPNKFVGGARITLGVIFVLMGIMKFLPGAFSEAWSIQLIDAKIPMYSLNIWLVPIVEILLGATLLAGYFSRLGAIVVLAMMFGAIYIHLTVQNPAAFPAQPKEPFLPIAFIMMALIVFRIGGGSWSLDLKVSEEE